MALFENDQQREVERSWNPYGAPVARMEPRTESSFLNGVYQEMAIGLGVTGVVAMVTAHNQGALSLVLQHPFLLIFAQLGMVMALSGLINRISAPVAMAMFYAYAVLMGLTMSVIFLVYTNESIATTFFITGGTFGAMSLYGYTTKRDLSGMGSFFMMGLVGLIIAGIANFWLQSSAVAWITSCVGVLLFVGLTAYDTQRIKRLAYELGPNEAAARISIIGALILYLDFINLFLYLLRFMGSRRR